MIILNLCIALIVSHVLDLQPFTSIIDDPSQINLESSRHPLIRISESYFADNVNLTNLNISVVGTHTNSITATPFTENGHTLFFCENATFSLSQINVIPGTKYVSIVSKSSLLTLSKTIISGTAAESFFISSDSSIVILNSQILPTVSESAISPLLESTSTEDSISVIGSSFGNAKVNTPLPFVGDYRTRNVQIRNCDVCNLTYPAATDTTQCLLSKGPNDREAEVIVGVSALNCDQGENPLYGGLIPDLNAPHVDTSVVNSSFTRMNQDNPTFTWTSYCHDMIFPKDGYYANGTNNFVLVTRCIFRDHDAKYSRDGGVLQFRGRDTVYVTHCEFTNCKTNKDAGAVAYYQGKIYYHAFNNHTDCQCQGWAGGVVMNGGDTLATNRDCFYTNCTETKPAPQYNGAGLHMNQANNARYVYNCWFEQCSSGGEGGGLALQNDKNTTVVSCRFTENKAVLRAASIMILEQASGYKNPIRVNYCLFHKNVGYDQGNDVSLTASWFAAGVDRSLLFTDCWTVSPEPRVGRKEVAWDGVDKSLCELIHYPELVTASHDGADDMKWCWANIHKCRTVAFSLDVTEYVVVTHLVIEVGAYDDNEMSVNNRTVWVEGQVGAAIELTHNSLKAGTTATSPLFEVILTNNFTLSTLTLVPSTTAKLVEGKAAALIQLLSVAVDCKSKTLTTSLFSFEQGTILMKSFEAKMGTTSSSIITQTGGTLTIENSKFTSIRQTAGNGAAISGKVSKTTPLTVTNTQFTKCSSAGLGNCIAVEMGGTGTTTMPIHLTSLTFTADTTYPDKTVDVFVTGFNLSETISNTTIPIFDKTKSARAWALDTGNNANTSLIAYLVPIELQVDLRKPGWDVGACGHYGLFCQSLDQAIKRLINSVAKLVIHSACEVSGDVVFPKSVTVTGNTPPGEIQVQSNGRMVQTNTGTTTFDAIRFILPATVTKTELLSVTAGKMVLKQCEMSQTGTIPVSVMKMTGGSVEFSGFTITSQTFSKTPFLVDGSTSSNFTSLSITNTISPSGELAKFVGTSSSTPITITSSEFSQPDSSSSQSLSSSNQVPAFCSWSTAALSFSTCTATITSTSFIGLPAGGIVVSGATVKLYQCTLRDNILKPVDPDFPSLRQNIACSGGGSVSITSIAGGDGLVSDSHYWISQGDCTLSLPNPQPASPFFTPTLSDAIYSANDTHLTVDLTGTTLIPCGLKLSIFDMPEDLADRKTVDSDIVEVSWNETQISIELDRSDYASLNNTLAWRAALTFGAGNANQTYPVKIKDGEEYNIPVWPPPPEPTPDPPPKDPSPEDPVDPSKPTPTDPPVTPTDPEDPKDPKDPSKGGDKFPVWVIGVIVGALLAAVFVVILVFVVRRNQQGALGVYLYIELDEENAHVAGMFETGEMARVNKEYQKALNSLEDDLLEFGGMGVGGKMEAIECSYPHSRVFVDESNSIASRLEAVGNVGLLKEVEWKKLVLGVLEGLSVLKEADEHSALFGKISPYTLIVETETEERKGSEGLRRYNSKSSVNQKYGMGSEQSMRVLIGTMGEQTESGDTKRTQQERMVWEEEEGRYSAPEVARGETADWSSALFSLGLVLFEMQTGTAPFKGMSGSEASMELARGTLPDLRTLAPSELAEVTRDLLKVNKHDRPSPELLRVRLGRGMEGIEASSFEVSVGKANEKGREIGGTPLETHRKEKKGKKEGKEEEKVEKAEEGKKGRKGKKKKGDEKREDQLPLLLNQSPQRSMIEDVEAIDVFGLGEGHESEARIVELGGETGLVEKDGAKRGRGNRRRRSLMKQQMEEMRAMEKGSEAETAGHSAEQEEMTGGEAEQAQEQNRDEEKEDGMEKEGKKKRKSKKSQKLKVGDEVTTEAPTTAFEPVEASAPAIPFENAAMNEEDDEAYGFGKKAESMEEEKGEKKKKKERKRRDKKSKDPLESEQSDMNEGLLTSQQEEVQREGGGEKEVEKEVGAADEGEKKRKRRSHRKKEGTDEVEEHAQQDEHAPSQMEEERGEEDGEKKRKRRSHRKKDGDDQVAEQAQQDEHAPSQMEEEKGEEGGEKEEKKRKRRSHRKKDGAEEDVEPSQQVEHAPSQMEEEKGEDEGEKKDKKKRRHRRNAEGNDEAAKEEERSEQAFEEKEEKAEEEDGNEKKKRRRKRKHADNEPGEE
ncbi:hypothetical protein BLNAU_19594 [Blattamonas nauphoetae]|uniref:Protein kinase domain-containing protein n=1 Tax=Blattamonas nauphoetae TaxID=2049346 RepID=A0ABQ9X1A5_9EUKA|nr:hypothetical protein BLNAU_19594 [Blattamonas nauphoetae]